MKFKFFSVFAFAACLPIGLTSCTDNEDFTKPSQETPDYTVIYWGSAGYNEAWTLSDLSNLMLMREDGSINNKVNLVGCLDPTMKYSKALADKNLGGTIEFELGTKRNTGADTLSVFKDVAGFENGFRLDAEEAASRHNADYLIPKYMELYSKVFPSMKSCKANADYNIYSSQSLGEFIKKAAKEHPAKNYVLLFYGHGTGYIPGREGSTSAASRGCISSTDGKMQILSLDDVTNAISSLGVKIQTVFYQCCQMAALENFASMKNVTDYVVASAEPTEGGYFPEFISYLSEVGSSEEGMKTACKKTVDHYASCVGSSYYKDITSHGFYDLSYTDQLLKPVAEAATWFASAAKTNPQFMTDVVLSSEAVYSTKLNDKYPHEKANELQKVYSKTMKGGKFTLPAGETLTDVVTNIVAVNNGKSYGVCFADMMEKAFSDELAAEAKGLDTEALRKIYADYLSVLKQMAYIRCNGTEANDAAYRFASPSVNLISMTEIGYQNNVSYYAKEGIDEAVSNINKYLAIGDSEKAFKAVVNSVGGTFNAFFNPSLPAVKATYQATDFDKATGWSKVMENIQANTILLVNPTRYDIINK